MPRGIFSFYFVQRLSIRESKSDRSLSESLEIPSSAFLIRAGLSISSSKKSLGVTPSYLQIYRNSAMEGKLRPLTMLCM